MKIANLKKAINESIAVLLMATFLMIAPVASAHHDDHSNVQKNLKLYGATNRTSSSVVLPFKYKKFRNDKINVVVSIRKKGSGKVMEKAFETTLSSKGKGSVTVTGLDSGIRYKFKVKLKRINDGTKYTKNSATRSAKTI